MIPPSLTWTVFVILIIFFEFFASFVFLSLLFPSIDPWPLRWLAPTTVKGVVALTKFGRAALSPCYGQRGHCGPCLGPHHNNDGPQAPTQCCQGSLASLKTIKRKKIKEKRRVLQN